FPFAFPSPQAYRPIFETRPDVGRDTKWRVRHIERHITEKGTFLVPLDELDGMVGEIVRDKTASANHAPVVLQRRIEIFAPMPGGEAVVFIQAPRIRMIGPLAAVMP